MTGLEGGGGMDQDDTGGRPIVLPPGHPLSELLAAATAPGTARELAGEEAAAAAFRAAHPMGRLLTLKIAAAALATMLSVGGMALATNAGAEHGPAAPVVPAPVASTASAPPPPVSAPPPPTSAPPPSPRPAPSATKAAPRRSDSCPSARDRDHGRDRDGRRWDRERRSCRSGERSRRGTDQAGDPAPGGSDHGERAVRRAPHRFG